MRNKNNDKNKVRTDKRFSVVIFTCFALFIGAVVLASGSTATMSVYAVTTQTLPTCVDPTGHNLPCIMVISTLPPPPNPLQCQETSGQILACSYTTQNLSNGELILVITVYVPVNYVFTGYGPWTVMMQVVHEPTTTKNRPDGSNPPGPYTLFVTVKVVTDPIVRGHIETITVTVSDNSNHRMKIVGAKVSGEFFYASGSNKPVSCTATNQNGESQCSSIIGPNSTPGAFKITVQVSKSGYNPASKSAPFTVIPKANPTSLANATIPINASNAIPTNKTNPSNMTEGNMTVAAPLAGPTGKGGGSNGTHGMQLLPQLQPPTVDCNANPSDPSCSQQPPPKTQTCPDGSVIDASASCPTQSTPPPTNQPPSTDNNNPQTTDNNPTPPSDNNHNDNGNPSSSHSDKGGDKSSGG